jgi:hypothetical protein
VTSEAISVLFALTLFTLPACSRETRAEGRQRRLDTFLAALPDSLRTDFQAITSEDDCSAVGQSLEEALILSPDLAARIDSIVDAELIDGFTCEEIVYYFWYYFDHALETGAVRGP